MAATNRVQQGALAPQAVRFTVTSDDPTNFDLSTGVTAQLDIKRGSGKEDTWSATIEAGATPAQAVLVHLFVAGDVPDCDEISVVPIINLAAGGPFVGEAQLLIVEDKFKVAAAAA